MPNKKRTIFTKILIWRYKYISERQFILVLSVIVGFLAGLGTVLLKYLTLFIQSVLEGGFIRNYYYSLYFIFPIVGVWLVYLIKKNFVKFLYLKYSRDGGNRTHYTRLSTCVSDRRFNRSSTPQYVVLVRLELTTSTLSGWRSNQLNYKTLLIKL